MKTALLSNVNVESLARRVGRDYDLYIADGFGAWARELADPSSGLWQAAPSLVTLLMDGAELLRSRDPLTPEEAGRRVSEAQGILAAAADRNPQTTFLVSTVDVPPDTICSLARPGLERGLEAAWLEGLQDAARARPNLLTWDIKARVEEIGRARFYSRKRWYFGGLRFSVEGEKTLAAELRRVLRAYQGKRKKCLVLDLDNTLWGGIVGEDGPEGLALDDTGPGARYKDFQRRVKELKELGVILALASKNNADDALEVIREHPHMVLREDDFAAMKIDWSPKPKNLAALAELLNIGRDSLVFIDDNPVERGAVQSALPEVTVPEFPADTAELPAFLHEVYREHFLVLAATDEDARKTEMMRENARRAEAATQAGSAEDFLRGLQTRIEIGPVTEKDLPRAAQLTQKTNQFNLTTRRYTEADLARMREREDALVLLANVSDRFGDNGKCCLAIVELDGDRARLDSFLMSCRVMGRGVEDEVLAHLADVLRERDIRECEVEVLPTAKNTPARTWAERVFGPSGAAEDAPRTWTLKLEPGWPVTEGFATLVAVDADEGAPSSS